MGCQVPRHRWSAHRLTPSTNSGKPVRDALEGCRLAKDVLTKESSVEGIIGLLQSCCKAQYPKPKVATKISQLVQLYDLRGSMVHLIQLWHFEIMPVTYLLTKPCDSPQHPIYLHLIQFWHLEMMPVIYLLTCDSPQLLIYLHLIQLWHLETVTGIYLLIKAHLYQLWHPETMPGTCLLTLACDSTQQPTFQALQTVSSIIRRISRCRVLTMPTQAKI